MIVAEPTTAIARRRRPRGQYPKKAVHPAEAVEKKLPEYLEAHEIQAIIRAADDPRARLLMMEQWRAGLRVSEALALEVADLSLDAELPTIRVRQGKGRKSRIVPVHPELGAALSVALSYGNVSRGASSTFTGQRLGAGCRGRTRDRAARGYPVGSRDRKSHVTTQLRSPSAYERHPHQLPVPLAGTFVDPDALIYLELVPDPTGTLAMVP